VLLLPLLVFLLLRALPVLPVFPPLPPGLLLVLPASLVFPLGPGLLLLPLRPLLLPASPLGPGLALVLSSVLVLAASLVFSLPLRATLLQVPRGVLCLWHLRLPASLSLVGLLGPLLALPELPASGLLPLSALLSLMGPNLLLGSLGLLPGLLFSALPPVFPLGPGPASLLLLGLLALPELLRLVFPLPPLLLPLFPLGPRLVFPLPPLLLPLFPLGLLLQVLHSPRHQMGPDHHHHLKD
jgi:hypothetical protein